MWIYLIPIATGIAVWLLFSAFLLPAVEQRDVTKKRLQSYEPRTLNQLNEKYKKEQSLGAAITKRLNKISARMNQNQRPSEKSEKARKELEQQLYSAGMDISVDTWQMIRIFSFIPGLVIGVLILLNASPENQTTAMLFTLVFIAAPMIVTRYLLKAKITSRTKKMERQLPDVLDLLAIAVDAGMGFDQALQYVITDMKGPFIDELTVTTRQMSFGKTRMEAFDALSKRCSQKSVTNFCSAVVQAAKVGIPIRNVLESQAQAIRQDHMAQVEQKAAKASIRMILPMVGFIFPVIFIVLLGPSVLSLMDNLL